MDELSRSSVGVTSSTRTQKRSCQMFCPRNGFRRSTSQLLYGVMVLPIMTSCIKIERHPQLAGPEEPVYYMILRGRSLEEIEKALRERPQIVKSFMWQGRTLLCCAAAEGREDVAELLLSMGADPNGPSDTCSPLINGISSENPDVVRVLLDHGASPLLPQEPFGFTPYEMAMEHGNKEIIQLLSQAELRDVKEVDSDDRKTQNVNNVYGDD